MSAGSAGCAFGMAGLLFSSGSIGYPFASKVDIILTDYFIVNAGMLEHFRRCVKKSFICPKTPKGKFAGLWIVLYWNI